MNALARASIGALGLAALACTAPASAETNRLLPFWGQPYPSGYAFTRRESAFARTDVEPRSRGRHRHHFVRRGPAVCHGRG